MFPYEVKKLSRAHVLLRINNPGLRFCFLDGVAFTLEVKWTQVAVRYHSEAEFYIERLLYPEFFLSMVHREYFVLPRSRSVWFI